MAAWPSKPRLVIANKVDFILSSVMVDCTLERAPPRALKCGATALQQPFNAAHMQLGREAARGSWFGAQNLAMLLHTLLRASTPPLPV